MQRAASCAQLFPPGDPRATRVVFYNSWNFSHAQIRKILRVKIAPALLPALPRLFPRHRWTGACSTFFEFTLLSGFYNVLGLVGTAFFNEGDGSKATTSGGPQVDASYRTVMALYRKYLQQTAAPGDAVALQGHIAGGAKTMVAHGSVNITGIEAEAGAGKVVLIDRSKHNKDWARQAGAWCSTVAPFPIQRVACIKS